MFIRLTAIADRLVSLESVFDYELTDEPMALFKNGLMPRKTILQEVHGSDSEVFCGGRLFFSLYLITAVI